MTHAASRGGWRRYGRRTADGKFLSITPNRTTTRLVLLLRVVQKNRCRCLSRLLRTSVILCSPFVMILCFSVSYDSIASQRRPLFCCCCSYVHDHTSRFLFSVRSIRCRFVFLRALSGSFRTSICSSWASCCYTYIDIRAHEKEVAKVNRQVNEVREAKDEEIGKLEFEIQKHKGDLDIANKKLKVRPLSYSFYCVSTALAFLS